MKITDVKIRKVDKAGNKTLKAFVDIVLDECFVVHGIRIIQGSKGKFIAMPSNMILERKYRDIVHPLSTDFRRYMTKTILTAYGE